jgi:hypothetical protein
LWPFPSEKVARTNRQPTWGFRISEKNAKQRWANDVPVSLLVWCVMHSPLSVRIPRSLCFARLRGILPFYLFTTCIYEFSDKLTATNPSDLMAKDFSPVF